MKITDDVLAVLKAATTEGNALTLTGQLDRGLYERTNKALEASGGKWNRKAKAHLFEGDAGDALDQLVTTGQYVNRKVELQQFYTPDALALQVVRLADVRPGMMVLEPSAGQGALARKARAAGATVMCIEQDRRNADVLEAAAFQTLHQDFLAVRPDEFVDAFDRVVMNPPFAGRADIRHVMHALSFLKPGGRLVAIMSAGVAFRTDSTATRFREVVELRHGEITAVDEGAFRESGTMVRTVIVSMEA